MINFHFGSLFRAPLELSGRRARFDDGTGTNYRKRAGYRGSALYSLERAGFTTRAVLTGEEGLEPHSIAQTSKIEDSDFLEVQRDCELVAVKDRWECDKGAKQTGVQLDFAPLREIPTMDFSVLLS